MPSILNDKEIRKLLGTVIVNGDPACIRPNAYVLRLGGEGEFITTGKEFDLEEKRKKGIRIQAGHAVGITAYETLDFRRETVHKIFPGCDLHGIVSPTTDLSREGVFAPTTQVDAGFYGTLNWTLTNSSSSERRFLLKERIYRITIFRLGEGETPDMLYTGDYQLQQGYVRSRRAGPPVGMKESEWEDAQVKGGPEDILDNLMRAGYPWHLLGTRFKEIDGQLKTVSDEYAVIQDSFERLSTQMTTMQSDVSGLQTGQHAAIRAVLKEEASASENRWMIKMVSLFAAFAGVGLSLWANEEVGAILQKHGGWIGVLVLAAAITAFFLVSRRK